MGQMETLLQPGRIGNLEIKNRIIYASMSLRSTDGMGHLTEEAIESMVYRAKQSYSPGLVIFPGLQSYHEPGTKYGWQAHISNEETARRLALAVKRVKINDVKVMATISARGTRQVNGTHDNVGPSAIRFAYEPYPTRALTVLEIKERIQDFIDAVCRAREAGFDAAMLHACSGKFISMFLSPYSNQRTDAYGGDVRGRTQILIEILQGIREKVGKDYPLVVQPSVDDMLGKYGLVIDEGIEIAKLIEPYIDAIYPSTGTQEKIQNISVGYTYDHGYMLDAVARVKQAVNIPVIAMGKLGIPSLAERIVATGQADFIALGRPLLVDPEWMEKAVTGEGTIRPCIGCLNCFTYASRKEIMPMRVSCTMNPGLLREADYETVSEADVKKKMLVVGGGLAGIEAALTFSRRGHDVTLAEQTDVLGGQWLVAAHAPHKKDYKLLMPYKLEELAKSTVKVKKNCPVDEVFLRDFQPDEVVLATGALPKVLPFDLPADAVPVVQGNDVIMRRVEVGQRVVVIGGRYIGLEVAAQLATEGKDVSIVDMDEFAKGANPRLVGFYRDAIVENGARMYPNCPVLRVTNRGVDIAQMNNLLTLTADSVVLCIGTQPQNRLEKTLEKLSLPYFKIGDCKRIGDALYAIRDGAEIGRLL
ncbi:MAG: FAD-dependent oxidoreductase [Peptococcaceae bacterium]|nr:FAD-dependent oxidoreductase [Peptococcaceae bacterium]